MGIYSTNEREGVTNVDQSECSNMTIDLSQMGVHLKNKKQYVGGLKHRAPGP